MTKLPFAIQMAEFTYNDTVFKFRPLNLGDLPRLIREHGPQIRTAIQTVQAAVSSADPAAIEVAKFHALAELGPAITLALAISANAPEEVDAFALLPLMVQIRAIETVRLLTMGNESAESLLQLVDLATASIDGRLH